MNDLGAQLTESLQSILRYWKQRVHTALPGRIVSFDPGKQTAEVEICIQSWMKVEGGWEKWPAPLLPRVPVLFPRGGGAFITWPIKKGDYCLVIFQERSIDQWCQRGGTQVDPIWRWEHDLSDAVCIPGFYPYPEALRDFDPDAICVAFEDGNAKLRVTKDAVEVGGATDFVALAGKVDAALEALKEVFANWTPVTGDGGTALKTALTALLSSGWPHTTKAAKAKAE